MKKVLVTGASSGIGEATAKYLAKSGYELVLAARNEERLKQVCEQCGEYVHHYLCDLSDLHQISSIFAYCEEINCKLDGLVHCAGIAGNMPVRGIDIHSVIEMMNVNCMSFIELARCFINRKYSNEGAGIVAMSSLSSITCYPGTVAYSASKAALSAACKVLAKEAMKRKIRVNTIMPGYVRTPMMEGMSEEDVCKEQPLGFVEPEEVAYLIEFLLSDRAVHITGSSIPLSGGMNF